MRALQLRAEQLARIQQRRRLERLEQELRDSAPGLSVESSEGQVVVEGRRLLQRWLSEPALRWAGSLGR